MKGSTRLFSGFATVALFLTLSGCGGNSGTQPTSLDRTLDLSSVTVYPSVRTSRVPGNLPIALFTTDKGQNVVLWGTRSGTDGTITNIGEAAYYTDIAKPLYAKYNSDGGLTSVKDIDSGSYVTFSELDGSSLVATGFDAGSGNTGSIRATLSDIGVTIEVIDDGRTVKRQVVPIEAIPTRGIARDVDPLAGFADVSRDSETRIRIITAIFRAASLVVDKPFDEEVRTVAGFLLLDQLTKSYTDFTGKGLSGTVTTDDTPVPYLTDLP